MIFFFQKKKKIARITLQTEEPRKNKGNNKVKNIAAQLQEKGFEVKGLDKPTESIVFHSGTSLTNGQVITNGGRVFAVTSLDETMQGALNKSYRTAHQINFDYAYYRKDIGQDLM